MAQWKQYSGMWTRQQQMQAAGAATWPGVLVGKSLFSFGRNNYGQLGQNNIVYYSSPTQIGASTNWSNISCGFDSSSAISSISVLEWS